MINLVDIRVARGTHLYAHIEQESHISDQRLFVPSQIVEQGTMLHVLGDDIDGSMLRAYAVQLHQIWMLEFSV